jgi:hypothetical protein
MSMIGNFLAIPPDRLAALIAEPSLVHSLIYQETGRDPEDLDIDKSWHAIHYTLNGSAWEGDGPLALAVMGGEEIGEDVGYGPARYLDPAQVKAVAAAISLITPQDFSTKFNPAALDAEEIYPEGWDGTGPEALEYVLDYYSQLSSFYQAAAERGYAVISYIN